MDSLVQIALSPSSLIILRHCGGSDVGTPQERSALLKTERIQTFLSTAFNSLQNGGPHKDQEYKFNCRLLTLYPLHFAAMVGDVDTIKSLIHDQKRDPNEKCSEMNDTQAVGLAAAYGHLLAVIALLMVCVITMHHYILLSKSFSSAIFDVHVRKRPISLLWLYRCCLVLSCLVLFLSELVLSWCLQTQPWSHNHSFLCSTTMTMTMTNRKEQIPSS